MQHSTAATRSIGAVKWLPQAGRALLASVLQALAVLGRGEDELDRATLGRVGITARIDITTYTAERDDVDETLFPHGSTMPAGAGQPPVIGEIVKLREPLFDPSGSSARREAAR